MILKKLKYPIQLNREDYFKCPIWSADAPEFVGDLNKASDKYIKESKKAIKPDLDKKNKLNKSQGDFGSIYHSTTLIGDPDFKTFTDYIGATSNNPSYMPHQYMVDMGVEPFRFIHFNCQAIMKGAVNVVSTK